MKTPSRRTQLLKAAQRSWILCTAWTGVLFCCSVNGVVSVIWLPSGLALAALLLGGKRYACSVFLGAFLINIISINSFG